MVFVGDIAVSMRSSIPYIPGILENAVHEIPLRE
jgi:hypothetical protein